MKHITPIVTNARQGKPLSTLNRRRNKYVWPIMLTICTLFWVAVATAFFSL